MTNRTSRLEKLLTVRSMPVKTVIDLLRVKNLLRTSMTCPHCKHDMKERAKDVVDGVSWVCSILNVPSH